MPDNHNAATPVDLSYLLEYTDGEPEAMNELMAMFYETAEGVLIDLKDNMTEGENKQWSEAAHKLKGAAGFVGADELKTLCAEAQAMMTATQADRTILYEKIKNSYTQVYKFMERISNDTSQ